MERSGPSTASSASRIKPDESRPIHPVVGDGPARDVGKQAGRLWSVWFGHHTRTFWAITTRRHPWDGHIEARDALTLLAKINEVDAFYGGPRRRPHGEWGVA